MFISSFAVDQLFKCGRSEIIPAASWVGLSVAAFDNRMSTLRTEYNILVIRLVLWLIYHSTQLTGLMSYRYQWNIHHYTTARFFLSSFVLYCRLCLS